MDSPTAVLLGLRVKLWQSGAASRRLWALDKIIQCGGDQVGYTAPRKVRAQRFYVSRASPRSATRPSPCLGSCNGAKTRSRLRTWSCDGARARDRLGTSLTNVKDLLAHAISEVPYIRPDPRQGKEGRVYVC